MMTTQHRGKTIAAFIAFGLASSFCLLTRAGDVDLLHPAQWNLQSGIQNGVPTDATDTHKTMSFTGTMVRFNEDLPGHRKLSYTVDTTVSPHQMTVFNDVGGRHFVIYSCLYVVHGKKLDLTFNPGADMPATMKSTAKNGLIELHFDS